MNNSHTIFWKSKILYAVESILKLCPISNMVNPNTYTQLVTVPVRFIDANKKLRIYALNRRNIRVELF